MNASEKSMFYSITFYHSHGVGEGGKKQYITGMEQNVVVNDAVSCQVYKLSATDN